MHVSSNMSADHVISQMISALQSRGAGVIRIVDAQVFPEGGTYLLSSAGEHAVVQVVAGFKRADIEGGGMPGPYWVGTLEAADWRPGTPRSLQAMAKATNLPIHRLYSGAA